MKRSRMAPALLAIAVMVTGVPAPGEPYEAVTVSDGGAIKGKVLFQGSPPAKRKVIPTKDREVCGSGVREVDQILLGPDNAVEDAVVYLKAVEKGKGWEKSSGIPHIDNVKCDFRPHLQIIPAGDFEIVNSDPVLHNTHGFYGKLTAFNVALPNQGQRIKRPLKKPGLVRVECDAHGWMLGWVYVADNPYYAVTAKDGTFTIKDVPPGSYTLVGWQEYAGEVEIPVVVKAKEVMPVTVELKK
jgi:polysaccharide lyase family 4-like protein